METFGLQATYQLLTQFDAFCASAQISYFAIDETLVGAVIYEDFIPNNPTLSFGMLRSEADKLQQADCSAFELEICNMNLFEILMRGKEGPNNLDNGDFVSVLRISIFDGITTDYDLAHFHIARVSLWRKLQKTFLCPIANVRLRNLASYYSCATSKTVTQLAQTNRVYVSYNHVAATQRLPFGPTTILVPADTSRWIEQDRTAQAERVRSIQKDCLRIANEIMRICQAHNIGFFIVSGTLLGALRYEGFIPWDDDIDIGMLRADYNQFLSIAEQELGSDFFIQSPATDPNMPYLYTKVHLNNTEYITPYTQHRESHKGIAVDIFPFDLAPMDEADFPAHKTRVLKLAQNYKTLARRKLNLNSNTQQLRPMEYVGRIIMNAWRNRYAKISLLHARADYEDCANKWNDGLTIANSAERNKDQYKDYSIVSYVIQFTHLPLEDLVPLQELSFEGIVLPAPRKPDVLLQSNFGGNYMQEPPVHERQPHQLIRWRTSDDKQG